ncbi:MAG: PqqD family protein [Deltaproteobacteria bacterium]|nr:PqqD family protein [Deltaproteobacteria bacterium]
MPQPQATPQAITAYTMHPAAAAREVAGEIFVVTDDRGLHRLEVPTAVTICRSLMAGPADREALVAQLVADFEVEWDVAARDLDAFVALLVERRIAVQCAPTPPPPLSAAADSTTLSRGRPSTVAPLGQPAAPPVAASVANEAAQHEK